MSELSDCIELLKKLEVATQGMSLPMVNVLCDEFGQDPFLVLISCLLSLRAKDKTTLPICRILFKHVKTHQEILNLHESYLQKLFYPLGFYKKKALLLHSVCRELLERFDGKVPATFDDLLSIKGVGRKTAALVLAEGFNIPAICVDTHVHRIANRIGLISTKTPEQTEIALQRLFPKEDWAKINRLLVMWGQNICLPISPKCSICPLQKICKRIGVKKSR